MDLVDWIKMVWIVMDNELSITKPIKIYNKQKLNSINKKITKPIFLTNFTTPNFIYFF